MSIYATFEPWELEQRRHALESIIGSYREAYSNVVVIPKAVVKKILRYEKELDEVKFYMDFAHHQLQLDLELPDM